MNKVLALVVAAHLALPAMPMDIEETIIPIVQPPSLEVQPPDDEKRKERNREILAWVLTIAFVSVVVAAGIKGGERCNELRRQGMYEEFYLQGCVREVQMINLGGNR